MTDTKRPVKDYVVSVPIRATKTYLVKARSKAEAIRKCRECHEDAEGLDFDVYEGCWSAAVASVDGEPNGRP